MSVAFLDVALRIIAAACDADRRHLDTSVHDDAAGITVHTARKVVNP